MLLCCFTDHLQSKRHTQCAAKHKADASLGITPKWQTTIDRCNKRQTVSSNAKEDLIVGLVKAFMSANTPFEKLDNPQLQAFIAENIKVVVRTLSQLAL